MDKTIKRKWLKALRSGEYEQGIDVLCNANNKFCCLGVLVNETEGFDLLPGDMYTTPNGWQHQANLPSVKRKDGWAETGAPTPAQMRKWGLTDAQCSVLIALNDGNPMSYKGKEINPDLRNHSFAEIADWIEGNL